jgi:hypothetical protein
MRGRRDRGEGAVNYIAVILLVAGVGVAVMNTGAGARIGGAIDTTICKIAQQNDCGEVAAAGGPARPRPHAWTGRGQRQQQQPPAEREVIDCTDWLWVNTFTSDWGPQIWAEIEWVNDFWQRGRLLHIRRYDRLWRQQCRVSYGGRLVRESSYKRQFDYEYKERNCLVVNYTPIGCNETINNGYPHEDLGPAEHAGQCNTDSRGTITLDCYDNEVSIDVRLPSGDDAERFEGTLPADGPVTGHRPQCHATGTC